MIQLLGTFFIFSLTGALSPGPLTTMAIAEGSRRGRWSGWWLSLGHGIIEGLYVLAIAVILWLGRDTLLQQPLVTGIIALVGGGLLLWMGGSMILAAWQRKLTLQGEAGQAVRLGLVPLGAVLSISNPYWWIWWALIASAFVGQSLAWGLGGVAVLFVVHWLTDFGWLTGLSWLTGSGRSLISPGVYRWVLIVCGAALIFFGVSFVGLGIQVLRTGDVNVL